MEGWKLKRAVTTQKLEGNWQELRSTEAVSEHWHTVDGLEDGRDQWWDLCNVNSRPGLSKEESALGVYRISGTDTSESTTPTVLPGISY